MDGPAVHRLWPVRCLPCSPSPWSSEVAHDPPRLRQRPPAGDRRFQARYVDRNGKTRTISFDSKKEASEHLAEARADLKRGRWQDPKIARRRFGEYANEWLDSRVDLKPTTRQQYAGTLRKHVLPHLGGYASRS